MLCRWKYGSSQRLDDSPSKIGNTIKTGEFLSARQKKTFESVLGKFDRRMQILFLSNYTRRKAGGNLLLISMLPRGSSQNKNQNDLFNQ